MIIPQQRLDRGMEKNPMQLFKEEFPDLADRFDQLVEAQRQFEGLDQKTKQLINIAIQTANRNPRGSCSMP